MLSAVAASWARPLRVTVRSAITDTLLVFGSIAHEVPGTAALSLSVPFAAFSSAVLFSTTLATAPSARTRSAELSSVTFMTSWRFSPS